MNKGVILRLTLGAGIPIAILVSGFGPFLAYSSELPNQMASHYNLSGIPDKSMSPTQFLMVSGLMMVLGVTPCIAVSLIRRKLQPAFSLTVSSVGAFTGGTGAAILAIAVTSQRGLEHWQDATFSNSMTLIMIISGVVAGALAAWVAYLIPLADGRARSTKIAISKRLMNDFTSTDKIFWGSTLYTGWPVLVGLAALTPIIIIVHFTNLWIGVILLLPAIAVANLSRISVTANKSGFYVRYGFIVWPRTSIPLKRIASTQAIKVNPKEWGGWGYRGNLIFMKRAAVVLRAGPGIRVDFHDGRVFVVTIDEPHVPVQILNTEILRLNSANDNDTDPSQKGCDT